MTRAIAAEHEAGFVDPRIDVVATFQRELVDLLHVVLGSSLTNLQKFALLHVVTAPEFFPCNPFDRVTYRQAAEAMRNLADVLSPPDERAATVERLKGLGITDEPWKRSSVTFYLRASDLFIDCATALARHPNG